MAGFPGDSSFEHIAPSIFRVETKWAGGSATATAFVVAMFRDCKRPILATAKHVLDFPDDQTVVWTFDQFDEHGEIERHVSFSTNKSAKGDIPYRTHGELDVGILILPATDHDAKPLARENESPVRTIDILSGVSTGTRVAWAGFPAIVEHALGFPQLCYFEGVVSAMVNRADKKIYVVDGHGARGVSGGPVWQWSAERNRLEVVGIVCEYRYPGDGLPGFCFFEPINPILSYFETEPWHPDKVGDHVIVNRYG